MKGEPLARMSLWECFYASHSIVHHRAPRLTRFTATDFASTVVFPSQLGIRRVYVTNAVRVEKAFLKSGVLADPQATRRLLVEGLSQQASRPPFCSPHSSA